MPAEISNDVIVATERIHAAPEVVFPYFTDPALIVEWIGIRAELEPQPGGTFLLDMGEVIAQGTYVAVEPPRRVVFTWGVPGDATLPVGGTTVEVVLTAEGADTLVVLTHRGLGSAHLESHRAGWAEKLSALAAAAA